MAFRKRPKGSTVAMPATITMSVDELKPADYNPRSISKEALSGLRTSIERWGLVSDIVVNRRTGNVVGGHQRLRVLKKLGVRDVPVKVVNLPVAEEKALNVALNHPGLQGEFTADLSVVLAEIEADIPDDVFSDLRMPDLQTEFPSSDDDEDERERETKPPEWVRKPGGSFKLITGDCVEKLKKLDENSVDAVVTDPPYFLEFMGKAWDSIGGGSLGSGDAARGQRMQEWHGQWTHEVYRVLKPGGYLVAFGGTRTYHRMVCAIEDSGFEIRDCLSWMYGSGFPKSLDIAKAFDRRRHDRTQIYAVTSWIRSVRDAAGISNTDIDLAFEFHGMAGHWTSNKSQPAIPTLEQVPKLLETLGDPEVPEEIAELLITLNGSKGQPGEAWFRREFIRTRDDGAGNTGTEVVPFMPPDSSVYDITAPATEAAQRWHGWGTALKPAHEPIVLARKLISEANIAANVERWGTGGLNIDGCQIEGVSSSVPQPSFNSPTDQIYGFKTGEGRSGEMSQAASRWPANIALGCACEGEHDPGCAVRMLDAQSGEVGAIAPVRGTEPSADGFSGPVYGSARGRVAAPFYGDTGGASRFFYTAKASRAEREAGLEQFPVLPPGGLQGRHDGTLEGDPVRARNHHPTVKPVDLMRWLVRLVTPPDGTVLDPFTGSGSTGIATVLEGFKFIGIEQDKEYVKIARARIKYAMKQPTQEDQ